MADLTSDQSAQCCHINDCNAIQHIQSTLEFYQHALDEQSEHSLDSLILKYFEENANTINEYHHILLQHLSTGNKSTDNKNFRLIHQIFSKSIKCDIGNCKKYMRNNRNRQRQELKNEYEKTFNLQCKSDPNALFFKEFLDSIHCYFIHSIETGMRIILDEHE